MRGKLVLQAVECACGQRERELWSTLTQCCVALTE